MIDLHSHFLYGVDDGPQDLQGSLELLQQAGQVGISKILATPHLTEHSSQPDQQKIKEVFNEIKEQLARSGLNIAIQLAAEIYYSPDMISWAYQSWLFIGIKRSYILFDIPMQIIPPGLPETIFQLVRRKIIPILAHPERNREVQKNPQLLAEWIRLGCMMQMDAGSITGEFGRKCRQVSMQLIRLGYIHLVASDAHDCVRRNFYSLAQARGQVEKNFGAEWAGHLFSGNPQRVLDGELLVQLPAVAVDSRVNLIQKIAARLKSAQR
jgi:protein-tyrosine phosphatase